MVKSLLAAGLLVASQLPTVLRASTNQPSSPPGQSGTSCQESLFEGTQYYVGENPGDVLTKDFNGDGRTDVALLNYGSGSFSILLNLGNGTLSEHTEYLIGHSPGSLAGADLDNDGDLDLVVTVYSTDSVALYLNDGLGNFHSGGDYPASIGSRDLTLADFDGDGDVDLATTSYSGLSLAILENLGHASFAPPLHYLPGFPPNNIDSGDLDSDGDIDLAVSRRDGSDIAILHNSGTGAFPTSTIYSSSSGSIGKMVLSDHDRDGDLDLATTHHFSQELSLFKNAGNGSFGAPTLVPLSFTPWSIAAFDVDDDGDSDLVVPSSNVPTVEFLLNGGTAGFTRVSRFVTGRDTSSVAGLDLEGDGDTDLVFSNGGIGIVSSNFIVVQLNPGPIRLPGNAYYESPGSNPTSVCAGDLNGDSIPDLAIANTGTGSTPSQSASIFLNGGSATFPDPLNFDIGPGPASIRAADLDGDGDLDLVAVNVVENNGLLGSTVSAILNDGSGNFSNPASYTVGRQPVDVRASDVDGDGDLDLTTTCYDSKNTTVLLNDGVGHFSLGERHQFTSRPHSHATGDFDGDGDIDLAVTERTSGSADSHLTILANAGDGTYSEIARHHTGYNAYRVEAADFDRDGDLDLAVGRFGAGVLDHRLRLYRNQGDGTFSLFTAYSIPGAPLDLAVDDFDQDGDLDIAISSYEGDANYSSAWVQILRNAGDGSFVADTHTHLIIGYPRSMASADLNGDGDLDLAITGSGLLNILQNQCACSGGAPPPVTYCDTSPNSVGSGALIRYSGSPSLQINNLVLSCTDAVPGAACIFLFGERRTSLPWGDGLRCVATNIRRLPLSFVDNGGEILYPLDTDSPPFRSSSGSLLPGATLHFQLLYRDLAGGVATHNSSNGLEVTFCN